MNPWLLWGLRGLIIWAVASIITGIAWALAGIGTPDDDEIGSERWPRIDCPDEVEP